MATSQADAAAEKTTEPLKADIPDKIKDSPALDEAIQDVLHEDVANPSEPEEKEVKAASVPKPEEPESEPEPDEEEPDEGEGQDDDSWIDDDARTMAESYGFSEDDLKEFSSGDEFRRAALFADKKLVQAAKAAAEKPADEDAKPAPKVEDKPKETKAEKAKREKLDLSKFADFDELSQELAKSLRDEQERNEALEKSIEDMKGGLQQWIQEQQQVQLRQQESEWLNTFHDMLDRDDAELFGRTMDDDGNIVKLTKEQGERRQKVGEQFDLLVSGITLQAQRAGVAPQYPPIPVLKERAKLLALGSELTAKEKRKFQEEVSAQSRKRRPGGTARGAMSKPRDKDGKFASEKKVDASDINSLANSLASDPEVLERIHRIQEATGAA